jgi:hypothetical protein
MLKNNINQRNYKDLDKDLAIASVIFNRLLKIQKRKFPPTNILKWRQDNLPQRLCSGICDSKKLWLCLLFLSENGYIEIINRKKIQILRFSDD